MSGNIMLYLIEKCMSITKLTIVIFCVLGILKAEAKDTASIKEIKIASKHAVMVSDVLNEYSTNWKSETLKEYFAFEWMFNDRKEHFAKMSSKYESVGAFKKCDFYELADLSKELIEGAMFYKAHCTFGERILKSEFIVLELEGALRLAHINLTDE